MDSNSPDDLEDTARIDRRNTVLAQIEAALLADKLAIAREKSSDPYNSGVYPGMTGGDAWRTRRRTR
ncbi:MAG: hypothetical protein M3Y79_03135 [Pseudomonadota bacterium]|nr:hypothetical protein [Pseudomonadota bacterium]